MGDKAILIRMLNLEQIQKQKGRPIWIPQRDSMQSDLWGIVHYTEKVRSDFTVHFAYGWEWLDDVWAKYGEKGIFGLVEVPLYPPVDWDDLTVSKQEIIYIAGKITDDPAYRLKFAKAQEKLECQGYIVLNPAVLPFGMDYRLYTPINRAMIDASDKVAFLQDWPQSEGAMEEMKYALNKGKEILVLSN